MDGGVVDRWGLPRFLLADASAVVAGKPWKKLIVWVGFFGGFSGGFVLVWFFYLFGFFPLQQPKQSSLSRYVE